MAESPGSDLASVLSEELAACRKRGIERLDVSSHNQQPVPLPALEKLATQYATATRGPLHSRIGQLKYLLRDAVTAFLAEDETDAQLVSALFFGDSLNRVTKSAGELLDVAQRQFGYTNAVRFRHTRRAAFERFAEFLPLFVTGGSPMNAAEDVPARTASLPDDGVPLVGGSSEAAPAPEV